MHGLSLRPASAADHDFALHVDEACMRVYAERTWGRWNGCCDLDPGRDHVVRFAGCDVGLVGIEREPQCWFLNRLYVLPAWQNHGIGGAVLRALIGDCRAAAVPLRLTVLEVNPARRFYERHGLVVSHTIPPWHYMEWRAPP